MVNYSHLDWEKKPREEEHTLDPNFTLDVACQHGNLSPYESRRAYVPPKVWDYFESVFPCPDLKKFGDDAQPCEECEEIKRIEDKQKTQAEGVKRAERSALFELYSEFSTQTCGILQFV